MPTYRLHDHAGDDLGLLKHPAPNVEPGDVVLADGREALVTARVETEPRRKRGNTRSVPKARRSLGVDDEVARRERTWPVWHGSQELLLHVARLAAQCVAYHEGAAAVSMRLFVEVGADREEFETIDDFGELVTPEALRNFDRIRVEIGDSPGHRIAVILERYGRLFNEGQAGLVVESRDPVVAEALEQRVAVALGRGCGRFDRVWRSRIMLFVTAAFFAVLLAGLLDVPESPSWGLSIGLTAVCMGLAYLVLYELVPAVEVAPPGRSRFERARQVVLSLGIGLVAAGLAKWIYG